MNLREAAQQALDALIEIDSPLYVSEITRVGAAMAGLRAALADTQDWDEVEALRASLREHMAEIQRLRAACRQALESLEKEARSFEDWLNMMEAARTDLRIALAEDAMQRLTDVQQEIESVTNCHKKEGDRLSPPLPTLAVHVGYRYQSPVSGWDYGDHIPRGFDTDKWAHQKIYILQEQS